MERRFNNISEKNPNWSSYISFAEAVKGQKFTEQTISRHFYKLVKKNDYEKKDRKVLLINLYNLSNSVDGDVKQG